MHSNFSINELPCLVTVPGMRFLYLLALLEFSANHNNAFINKSLGRAVNFRASYLNYPLLAVGSRIQQQRKSCLTAFGAQFWSHSWKVLRGAGDALYGSLFPALGRAWLLDFNEENNSLLMHCLYICGSRKADVGSIFIKFRHFREPVLFPGRCMLQVCRCFWAE